MRSEQAIIFSPGYLVTSITFGRTNNGPFISSRFCASLLKGIFLSRRKLKLMLFSKHRQKGELFFLIETN